MKKRIAMFLCMSLVVLSLVGCGNETKETKTTANDTSNTTATAENNNYLGYVNLGEYKGIEVTDTTPVISDEEVLEYAKLVFNNYVSEEVGIKDRAVKKGDNIFFSFEGKVDGVAFDGGTSEGTMLEIGSGNFIPGFEDSLIGVMPGETVDVEVTFPEVYPKNPDLAGVPAVFTCEVFWIAPEMTDELVKKLDMGYEGIDALLEDTRAYLESSVQSDANTAIQNSIIDKAMANAEFLTIPEDLVEGYKLTVETTLSSYASMYGMESVDDFAMLAYGADAQTVIDNLSVEYAKQDIFFKAIAEAEGMSISDEQLDERLAAYATELGYESADDLLQMGMSKEEYRDYFIFDDVINFLVDNAVIK